MQESVARLRCVVQSGGTKVLWTQLKALKVGDIRAIAQERVVLFILLYIYIIYICKSLTINMGIYQRVSPIIRSVVSNFIFHQGFKGA